MTEPIIIQSYCSVAELESDLHLNGSETEAYLLNKIASASDFLQKAIGQFLPVVMIHSYHRHDEPRHSSVYIKPLLSVDSIVIGSDVLTVDDYSLGPDSRHWPNGPYSWIDLHHEYHHNHHTVYVTGLHGLYNRIELLNVKLDGGQQAIDLTMSVDNGALVSPGMVINIDDESEYIQSTGAPSNAVTTLAAALDAASEIISVHDGSLVHIGEVVRCGFEQMKVLDISGNDLNVVRGWNRTNRVVHAENASVDVYRTFNVLRGVNGTTAADHADQSVISRQMVPDDINGLCRIIAGNWLKFAQSGYQGKIGDQNTGQIIYQAAIPTTDLERIKAAYSIPTAG